MLYLIFLLLCFGITNSVINNSWFNFLRETNIGVINKFFSCSLCLGFWVGCFIYTMAVGLGMVDFGLNILFPVFMIFLGFMSSGFCYVFCGLGATLEKLSK